MATNPSDNLGNTPLHDAVSKGDEAEVLRLLRQGGIDVNIKNDLEETPLILAVKRSLAKQKPEIVLNLLREKDIDVNIQERGGETALMHSVDANFKPAVKALLERCSTKTSLQNKIGETAFTSFICVQNFEGKLEVLDWFLSHPLLDVNHTNERGWTALMLAMRRGGPSVVKRLLDHPNILVNSQNNVGQTALCYSVGMATTDQEALDLLLKREDLDVNIQDKHGNFALSRCLHKNTLARLLQREDLNLHLLYRKNLTKLRDLLQQNKPEQVALIDMISSHDRFHVNELRGDGHTDLTWAATTQLPHAVQYLLLHQDISVSRYDQNECSALVYLASWASPDLIKSLLNHDTFERANFWKKDSDSQTFLHHLFKQPRRHGGYHQIERMEYIISLIKGENVDISCADKQGNTALMCSIEFAKDNPGIADIVQAILGKCEESDISHRNKYNNSVLDLVKEYSSKLDAAVKGIFKPYMTEDSTQQQYQSNLTLVKQLKQLRSSIHGLKLGLDFTEHLVQQVDKLESDIDVFTDGHYGNELGMLKLHRDKLNGRHVFLLQNLETNEVIPYLKQEDILTDNQIEEIRAQKLRPRVATKLLSILPTRGPQAYQAFIDALNQTKQEIIAEELEKYNPDETTSGPSVSHNYGARTVAMATGMGRGLGEVVSLSVPPGQQMSMTFVVRCDQQDSESI